MSEVVEVHTPETGVEQSGWTRKRVAESLVNRHALLAGGVGFIPVLGFDVAALTGIQLNLINRLAVLYGVEFSKQAGLNIIVSLMAGALPVALLTATYSVLKVVPVIGHIAGSAAMSVNGAAIVYALGMVMVRHFESGGDMLDFDAKEAKAYFKEQMNKAPVAAAPTAAAPAAPAREYKV
jgi:uncharacterized protein (DUF697 family)